MAEGFIKEVMLFDGYVHHLVSARFRGKLEREHS